METTYYILNLTHLRCPDPIMMIRKKLRIMKNNDIVLVLTDDPSTIRDIPKLCFFLGHTLLKYSTDTEPYQHIIKKGQKNHC